MKVENLPASLKIQDGHLITCLNSIEEAINKLWDRPLLQHYTNHGIDHSQRIVEILGNLLNDYPNMLLNEHERFVLLASTYLHDIGMQSPQHAGLPRKTEYTIKELEKVRENHHEASAKIIIESISRKSTLSLGFEQCKEYVVFITTLLKYHRKLDLKEIEDTSFAGKKIRLKLLTALLRLSDALDADYRRVNIEILKLREIPIESKYYWWFHHYVQSIYIKKGHIQLFFRFPEEYREDKLIEVFFNRIKESVSFALFEVYDILDSYEMRLYPKIEIEEERYVPEALELIPDDLSKYIKENILRTKELSQEKRIQTDVVWYVNGVPYSDSPAVVKCLANVFNFINEGRNFDAAKEIERCRILTMGPKEKMILAGIAGSCYYILGNLIKAEDYYQDALKISERKDLEIIYKNDVILAKSAVLGNIGLIYRDKGELDEALRYHEEALNIDREIGYKQGEANQLNNIGIIYRTKGYFEKAFEYHLSALEYHREIGDKKGEASDLGSIGLIYSIKGDLDEALNYHQEALNIHIEIMNNLGEASQLVNIGLIYRAKGNLNEALQLHLRALDIDRKIGYKQGEASDLGNIGIIYKAKGDIDNALHYHQKALKLYKEIGCKEGEANSLGNIGNIYSDKGELDKELKYYQEALKIHREIGYKQGEASDLGNIGNNYKDRGEFNEALKYYKEAIKIDREIGYKQGEAIDLGNIGLIYRDKGELEEALRYHEEALKIDREIGYKQGEANQLGNMGLIYRAKGEIDKALKYHEEALKIDREIGFRQGEASDLGNMGLIYRDKGELKEALRYHEESLKINRKIGYRQGEANQLGNMGFIYRAKGEIDEAIKYLNEALKIFAIVSPPLTIQTINNIAIIYFQKQMFEKGFEYLARSMSFSYSIEQFNSALFAIRSIVRDLIMHNDWENLEKIHSTYVSGIILDNIWLSFFKAIHEYAKYKKTGDESYQNNYKSSRQKLNPNLKKLLDELLDIRK